MGCPLPRRAAALWDVTVLGSDANKLARLAGTSDLGLLRERFGDVMRRLVEMYREPDLPPEFEDLAQVITLKGALWRSKLAVLLREPVNPGESNR